MAANLNIQEAFSMAEARLAQGDLHEVARLGKEMIESAPNDPYGYYITGALFKATGNHAKAINFFDMALERRSEFALAHLQRGHALFCLGDVAKAKEALLRAWLNDSSMPMTALLLGDAYMKEGAYGEAMRYFKMAQALSDSPQVTEHMGLCQQLKGDAKEAEASFRTLIARMPDYADGYLYLSQLHMDQKRTAEAEATIDALLVHVPTQHEGLMRKAILLEQRGQHSDAIAFATRAVNEKMDFLPHYLILGALLVTHGLLLDAENVYRKAYALDPHHFEAGKALANTLITLQKSADAAEVLQALIQQRPEDTSLRHMLAAAQGTTTDNAPADYVRGIFDGYADRFEEHLQKTLGYKIPSLLADAITTILAKKTSQLALLDLGCGTGLAAEALRDLTGYRAGVDLAPKMIEICRGKKLYDELVVGDVVEYLRSAKRKFDLITGADMLIYLGSLDPLFEQVAKTLAPGGLFGFSLENGDDAPPFVLRPTARYAHALSYVETLGKRYGLEMKHHSQVPLRKEIGSFIPAHLCVMQKT